MGFEYWDKDYKPENEVNICISFLKMFCEKATTYSKQPTYGLKHIIARICATYVSETSLLEALDILGFKYNFVDVKHASFAKIKFNKLFKKYEYDNDLFLDWKTDELIRLGETSSSGRTFI